MKKRLLSLVLILCMMLATVLTGCNASDRDDDKSDKKAKKEDDDVVAEYKYDDDNIFGLKKIIVGKDEIELQFDCAKADEGYAFWGGYGDDVKNLDGTGILRDKKDEEVEAEFECRKQGSKYIMTASYEEGFIPDYFYFRETEIDGFKKPDLFYRMWGGECADTFSQSYDGKEWSDVEEGFESYPETCNEEDQEEFLPGATLDSYLTKDWQRQYQSLLNGFRSEMVGNHDILSGADEDIYCYWLYDINKDDTPELIVRFGNCEANYFDVVYTMSDGNALEVGTLPGGHTCYYGIPDEGLISDWGHMGCQAMYLVTMSNSLELSMESVFEEDINDDPELEYTKVEAVIPGACYICSKCYCLDLPLANYEKVIYTRDNSLSNSEVEEIFTDTVNNDGMVIPCPIEHMREKLPQMGFETFLEGGNIDEWSDTKDSVDSIEFQDMNLDGQSEAIVRTTNDRLVILNYQDGIVYAYVYDYSYPYELVSISGGALEFESDYNSHTDFLVFYNDQVYEECVYY